MTSQDTFNALPWLSDDDWKRMGFLQLSILSSLLTQERYGLEIRDHLMLNGYEIGTNQLYSSLNKLESSGNISSREEERKGVNRKFYKITEKGRSFFVIYTLNFIMLLQDVYPVDYLTPLTDLACEMIEPHITPKSVLFDFSIRYTDYQFGPVVNMSEKLTSPEGHFHLLSQNEIYTNVLKKKITYYGLDKVVSIKTLTAGQISLSRSSIDIAICNFMLHYSHNDWIIPELSRILKSGGYFFITNPLEMGKEEIKDIRYSLIVSLRKLSPLVPKIGINEENTIKLLKKHGLLIIEKKIQSGVIFLFGKKE
ncbi:MAG: helix-turn-helix transcriptional regulator [Candidatus Hodarchaeota archaeon]